MAIIWQFDGHLGGWAARPLAEGGAFLLRDPGLDVWAEDGAGPAGRVSRAGEGEAAGTACAEIRGYRVPGESRGRWALLATSGIRANGERLRTGIRVLRHRDVVHLGPGGEVVFSVEGLASAARITADRIGTRCPRCTRAFAGDDVVVDCPRCGSAHHETEGLNCWSHRPRCATCDCPTAGGEYPWTPESL